MGNAAAPPPENLCIGGLGLDRVYFYRDDYGMSCWNPSVRIGGPSGPEWVAVRYIPEFKTLMEEAANIAYNSGNSYCCFGVVPYCGVFFVGDYAKEALDYDWTYRMNKYLSDQGAGLVVTVQAFPGDASDTGPSAEFCVQFDRTKNVVITAGDVQMMMPIVLGAEQYH